jgi:hypothetical protein
LVALTTAAGDQDRALSAPPLSRAGIPLLTPGHVVASAADASGVVAKPAVMRVFMPVGLTGVDDIELLRGKI